jgi:hypothetical protein
MPKIQNWDELPARIRRHLIERLHDPAIGIADLNQLDSFKICGQGSFRKSFLLPGQVAKGKAVSN